MTSMCDEQRASQVMVGDELNQFAVRSSGCFFEQAGVQFLVEARAQPSANATVAAPCAARVGSEKFTAIGLWLDSPENSHMRVLALKLA